jgi:hypothetical protein
MIDLSTEALVDCFGIGVAGNFAGHLEQAGEAVDFTAVDAEAAAPKGIFPFFVPGADNFLGEFPLSSSAIALPPSDAPLNLQIEPEACVLCALEYDAAGSPLRLHPKALAAFNDCSIRRTGAKKISEKKNWGADSKGVAARAFEINELDADGAAANLRLACFLRRAGETFAYGVDSPLPGYSYFGTTLLDWIVERLQNQSGGETPLEPIGSYLRAAGSPERILIGIGATRYSAFGESHFLEVDDESIVIVYDASASDAAAVERAVASRAEGQLKDASVLTQLVRTR